MSLVVVICAGSTGTGSDRARYAAQQLREMVAPTGAQAARPLDANEGRRLADTVRLLSDDRERLLARIAALEHNVDDMTGSITRFEKSVWTPAVSVEQLQPVAPPAPAPVATTAPQTVAPAKPPMPQVSASPPAPQVATAPPPAAAGRPVEEFTSTLSGPDATSFEPTPPAISQANTTSVTKRQFGLDLGGSTSEEAARASWSAAVRRHGNLLQGFRPIIVPRDQHRGGTEYRLVAGPIADASRAARFCSAITSMGGVCQPTMYDGARVAGR